MKLNRMVCPACMHEMWTDSSYVTCDGCRMFFYASESAYGPLNRNTANPILIATNPPSGRIREWG